METNMKINNNQSLVLVILLAIIFFVFILPIIDNKNKKNMDKFREHLDNVNKLKKFDLNQCSKDCCRHVQWPVPKEVRPKNVSDEYKNVIGSNLTCNLGSGSGCLCVTKDDFNYLASRSANAGTNMCSN
jgi:hypothetical protein